jgi:uncharacterized protein (TIGR03437 family)
LDRLKTTVIAAFVIAGLFAPAAFGQTPVGQTTPALATAAKVAVVSGNGQLICPACAYKNARSFYPMVVKVTDANGNPITGKTVNWTLKSFMGGSQPSFDAVSTTNNDGLAFSRVSQNALQFGSVLQPFLQSVITATADTALADFTETLALTDAVGGSLFYSASLDAPIGTPLTGTAGGQGTSPILIRVGTSFVAFPGISVRILSSEVTLGGQVVLNPSVPTASCLTGPGADPGSVLTDATGHATCYPVFGPVAGTDYVSALVGGLDPIEFDQTVSPLPLSDAIAFDQFSGIQLVVTQVTPAHMNVVSGDSQQVDPGHASAPLVVQVTDITGAVPIGNQTVAFTVVSGAATVTPATVTSDATGRAQTIATFSPNATGQVIVKAALTGNFSGITATFTLSTHILISSLSKVSGDLQTTQSGQNFPAPLIVQVLGTNGLPLPSQPIGFSVTSGAATLSTLSANTDATGQASVTVTAGATPGTVTVNAFIGTFSIPSPFTLTVIPPGPALSSNSFYNAGGLAKIGALSPCSLVTVFASGLAPNVQGMVLNTTSFGPWATSLASDTVTVASVAAPIFSVGNVNGTEQLTFQVPCETAPGNSVPITISVGGGTGTTAFPVVAASPGIFETVMSDGARRAVAVRPDGTFVSLQNPARRASGGELIRVFVTGLGPTLPAMVTGSIPVPGADLLALGQVIVGVNNSGARVVSSRVSPNLIGIYEVTFQVPADAPPGNDIVLNVAVNAVGDTQTRFSNGSKLPIQ